MVALSLFNFFMVIMNIDNVITYRQNRPRIVTPINQQSGGTVPNQGNVNTNINYMFSPISNTGTPPGNMDISSSVAANGAQSPSPTESQISPTNTVFRQNDIISSTSPTVPSIAADGTILPSPGDSQTTPTNPVFRENGITSSASPTVTSIISTTPTVTEVVINAPMNRGSGNFTVEFPISIHIVISPNDNGYGLTTTPLLELPTVGSTTALATTATVNEITITSPSTNENTISTVSENPLSSFSTIGSTVETITEHLTAPTTTENNVSSVSDNLTTTLSTVGSTVELVTENVAPSTTESFASTLSEIFTASPIGNSNEINTENDISPSTTENAVTTVSNNPIAFPNTNENTVSSLSDSPITITPSTNEKFVQLLTENPINIDLADPASSGINFIFTTQSSAIINTGQPARAVTTNIDLSDPEQNGINFGVTPTGNTGPQNLQNRMIFEKKCEEYYSKGSRKTRTTKLQVFIVGGTNSLPHEFPHMAALGYRQEPKEWLCGGSLISENYVITAAHCLSSSTLGEIQFVRLGTTTLQTETLESEDYNVIRRIPHPEYSTGMQYNDIALLQLDRPVTFSEFIQPICLYPSKNIISQQTLIATGWGRTEPAGDVSPDLQKGDLEYFANNECQQIYSVISKEDLPRGIDDKTQLCAGSRNEQKDTCQGDSGGPLQIEENERFYLVGITSFGIACARPGSPGVYTRVSYYIPWIENIVWANEQ